VFQTEFFRSLLMDKPSLLTQALARIKAARLEAGADLLAGLDTSRHILARHRREARSLPAAGRHNDPDRLRSPARRVPRYPFEM